MSKKLVLCVVLALSLILVGTGYAYWTDTLNVTTKATTGDLDVTFVDLGAYAQYGNEYDPGDWSIIDGVGPTGYVGANFFERGTGTYNDVFGNPDKTNAYYTQAKGFNSVNMDADLENPGAELNENYPGLPYGTGTVAGDTISITLNNIYPGYAQSFRSDIINIGDIAAKLSTIDFKVKKLGEMEITNATKNLIGIALLVDDELPETTGAMIKLASNFPAADKFTLGGVEFVRLSALQNGTVDIGVNNLLLVPTPGNQQRGDLDIAIGVDPDAEGLFTTGTATNPTNKNDENSQEKGVQVDIKFGWDQFNEGNDPETTNILVEQNGNPVQP